jgi:hypothetical protein
MNRFHSLLALMCLLPLQHVHGQGTISGFDHFSSLVEWQESSGREVTPLHASLLPTGDIMFVSYFKFFADPEFDLTEPGFIPEFAFVMTPSVGYAPPPAAVIVQPELIPFSLSLDIDEQTNTAYYKSLVCSGHSLMEDGSLFFGSGTDVEIDLDLYNSGQLTESLAVDGLTESLTYNPFGQSWIQNPDTIGMGPLLDRPGRWYGTVTRLADSRMLLTGGYEKVVPDNSYNNTVEIFDPTTNAWSIVSDLDDTPLGIENPDYPHVFQYPLDYGSYDLVLMIGGSGEPKFLMMDGTNKFWYETGKYRPGAQEFIDAKAPAKVFPNHGSSSAMLPLRLPGEGWGYTNGSVMNVGGAHFTPMEGNIDVFDTGLNEWLPSVSMGGLRHHASTVILPDGRILILGGHDDMSPVKETGLALYVDPKNNFEVTKGLSVMAETRGYHTVSLLLPDGRVLIGSGNPGGKEGFELPNFRYYYPDYMFEPRPRIVSIKETMEMAKYSLLFVPHLTNVDEAVLIGLGSMTHSFDMSQRSVQLAVTDMAIIIQLTAQGWATVGPEQCVSQPESCFDLHAIQAPESEEMAPPGYYMLFILDENRVPSPAKMVKLERSPGS